MDGTRQATDTSNWLTGAHGETGAHWETGPAMSKAIVRNVDEHSLFLESFDQVYHQISAGSYLGRSKSFHLGEGSFVQLETYNQIVDQWGSMLPGLVSVIFLLDQTAGTRLGHLPLAADDIILIAPGGDYDLRSATGTNYCALVFPMDYLVGFMTERDGAALAHKNHFFPTTILSLPQTTAVLRQVVGRFVTAFGSKKTCENHATIADFRHALASMSADLIATALKQPGSRLESPLKSIRLAYKIRDFLRSQCRSRVTIKQLSDEFGISTRYMEKIFKTAFDLRPREYNHLIVINRFQAALLDPKNQNRTIGDIAADFDIWHLSRLAQQYKKQFHELPSRGRVRSDPAASLYRRRLGGNL